MTYVIVLELTGLTAPKKASVFSEVALKAKPEIFTGVAVVSSVGVNKVLTGWADKVPETKMNI